MYSINILVLISKSMEISTLQLIFIKRIENYVIIL